MSQWRLHFKTCHHVLTEDHPEDGLAADVVSGYLDISGRCPACRPAPRAQAPAPTTVAPVKYPQNVPTGLACPRPDCRGKLLIMTRKATGKRFLACSAWYGDARCDYTSNEIPTHLLMKEAGAPQLPGMED